MIEYSGILNAVGDAMARYQEENTPPHNETAICVAVMPCSDNAAQVLGLPVGEYSSHTDGSSTEKYVTKNCAVPMQELALAIARKKMRKMNEESSSGPIIDAFTDEKLLDSGCAEMCTICSPAEEGDIDVPAWAKIFVAVCDLSPVAARGAMYAGIQALKEYVQKTIDHECLTVYP